MGQPKALLPVDGKPMVERVAHAARDAGADRVVAVGGSLGDIDIEVFADLYPDAGPLGGIITGLGRLDADVVLVVACDLIHPSATAMRSTVEALLHHPEADLTAPMRGDQVEWTHAAWRREVCLAALSERFEAGDRAIHRSVSESPLSAVTVPDIDPEALADADVPGDLPR